MPISARSLLCAAPIVAALVALGGCGTSPHQQLAYDACNGDLLEGDCKLGISSVNGRSWIQAAGERCAAARWIQGIAMPDGTLKDKVTVTKVLPPQGDRMPESDLRQKMVDIQDSVCFAAKPIADPSERAQIIPDSEDPLTLQCDAPRQLFELAPKLLRNGVGSINPETRKMVIFGQALDMTDHLGSAYSGLSEGIAAAVHKTSGAYRVLLPGGIVLTGHCRMSVD